MRAPESELPTAFEDVSLRNRDVTIIDDVSLSITQGPPTFVIGPNGSGKSTLIRLAMRLIAPTSGRITWGGRAEGCERCAMVFQRPVMLRRSAAANVAYAMRADTRRDRGAITELLERVGLKHLADRPARLLSGGEQQRLALARALARNPELLFLDEPTASLDPASTKAVEDIVRTIAAAGVKIVMATHDLGQARRLAGDVIFMKRGRVLERAPAETFFEQPATPDAAAFLRGDLVI
jgi:tungstate transport system ATP-binding protein